MGARFDPKTTSPRVEMPLQAPTRVNVYLTLEQVSDFQHPLALDTPSALFLF